MLAILVAGFAAGVKYHAGVIAQRDKAAAELVKSDGIQQRKFIDKASGQHAAAVDKLSNQLGNARVQITKLAGRECFAVDTTSVLNSIGTEPAAAAAGEPAGAAAATASGGGLRFTTDADAASAIATCRARYGGVASQLNKILDIEEKRWPAETALP